MMLLSKPIIPIFNPWKYWKIILFIIFLSNHNLYESFSWGDKFPVNGIKITSIFVLCIKLLCQFLRRYCHIPLLKSQEYGSINQGNVWLKEHKLWTPLLSFLSFFSVLLIVEPIVPLTLVSKRKVALHITYPNWWWNSVKFQPLMAGRVLGH